MDGGSPLELEGRTERSDMGCSHECLLARRFYWAQAELIQSERPFAAAWPATAAIAFSTRAASPR